MKRKIEDYKDQKVAIHCSTQEEWDKIVDLLPSNRSVKKNCWQNSVNNGKSDTININNYGWSPKKHFENKGYTIYPALDFLEEKPFKFNIGDEIKAKPGGYYISSPQHFAESHKKQYPSNETTISGKITERTQAQGFNWYRCSYGNWITEEGVELIKEDIPEYVEYIDTKYKGQIVKVEEWTNHSFCCIRFENGQREQPFKNLVKPSTKEAFDLQNKPKTMTENIFCIQLNSQEELDAIMDFYKQKGFRERGNSQEYYGGYVVYISIIDKTWQTSVYNEFDYPIKTLSELGIEVKSKNCEECNDTGKVMRAKLYPSGHTEVWEDCKKCIDEEEVKPKSLVGRYLKALVNKPNGATYKKDDYIKIIDDNFKGSVMCDKSFLFGWDSYNWQKSEVELMPEGFKPEEEINTYGLKIGGFLDNKIISAWEKQDNNRFEKGNTVWRKRSNSTYIGDRTIESFKLLEGIVGFLVSGTLGVYLKAEGFKEFADNFYKKKEKEGMLEMLAYPKDNYFKAVVVKDIHKKDIETKGDMPDLIPKGYQTWFISENTLWRERILSKEDVICPESNRWRANIPPEYFEIVEEKESGTLVFGKYKVGDVVVSLEQKAPYRVVGDMFKVLESNIDALHYLHDTCSLASKEWRAATEEEIKAFQQGIKNVNDIPKIGDYVVITKGTDNWSSKMNHYIGKVAKLTSCLSDDKNTFRIDLDNGDWKWQLKHNHFRKAKPDEIPLKQITMSMQEIQQICKEKYPIGCKYKCVNFNSEYILLQDDFTYTIVNNEIWASYGKGCLYSNGKYAELISLPKSDWNPQIGDHVIIISPKEENNWTPGMDKYVGKLAKITKKREDTSFEIDLDNAYYVWDYKPHRKFFRKAEPHEISTISVTKKKREITLVPLIQPKTVKVFDREENFF